jgi:predicted ester cyclase
MDPLELIRRDTTPELHARIRELWKSHSIAEEKRDVAGLLATLTDDCVYEIVGTRDAWRGREGAAAFYRQLLDAYPDIDVQLRHIVIGPQGVWEEARVAGTHRKAWLGIPASARRVEFDVQILFPWDAAREKFAGERIHVDPAFLRRARRQYVDRSGVKIHVERLEWRSTYHGWIEGDPGHIAEVTLKEHLPARIREFGPLPCLLRNADERRTASERFGGPAGPGERVWLPAETVIALLEGDWCPGPDDWGSHLLLAWFQDPVDPFEAIGPLIAGIDWKKHAAGWGP